ncbi:MAG: hypothetical protein HWD59_09535 [Coxiellaceae bacterium]|nr:MAG: hypothetical protein HWD59_09535 [Coxiellaceae bacterium]
MVLTSDGPFDINDENTVSEAIKTKIFDDAKESQLFYQAAKICAISYRSIKTEENKKRIDDASAIVVDLSQMPHGNYLFVVSDGNSYYKLDKENLVAKKACKNLPVLLKTELEKHQYNSNNNRPSGQQSSFHDIENLSQEFSMLSQKISQTKSIKVITGFNYIILVVIRKIPRMILH